MSAEQEHADAIAAAEERGRRRGVEERDGLRAALKSAGVALNVATGWLTGLGRHKEATQMRGWHQKAMDALAPRDSAPVCDNCQLAAKAEDGRTHRGYRIGPCYCDRLRAPRDSGKEGQQ